MEQIKKLQYLQLVNKITAGEWGENPPSLPARPRYIAFQREDLALVDMLRRIAL